MATRSKEKAEKAIASLKEATGKEALFHELDLSSLASVKKSAEEFLAKEHELHILFNNAYVAYSLLSVQSLIPPCELSGVMIPPPNLVTKEGYDLQFGTNVVGHFYFTELLMPALIAGVSSSPDHHTRIITTSSSSAYMGKLNYDTFKDGPARKKLARSDLYNQSKLVCYPLRVSLLVRVLTIWHHRPTLLLRTRLQSATPTRASSLFL